MFKEMGIYVQNKEKDKATQMDTDHCHTINLSDLDCPSTTLWRPGVATTTTSTTHTTTPTPPTTTDVHVDDQEEDTDDDIYSTNDAKQQEQSITQSPDYTNTNDLYGESSKMELNLDDNLSELITFSPTTSTTSTHTPATKEMDNREEMDEDDLYLDDFFEVAAMVEYLSEVWVWDVDQQVGAGCCSSSSISLPWKNGVTGGPTIVEGEFECPICLDEVDRSVQFPNCHHGYCQPCVSAHLREQVYRNKGKKLTCPFPKCPSTVTHNVEFYSQFLDKQSLDKLNIYLMIQSKSFGSSMAVIFCCNCNNPLTRTDSKDLNVICDNEECKALLCFECATFAHDGMTCKENLKTIKENMSEDDKKSMELLEKEQFKNCPKCGVLTFKEDGCEYVCCLTCGHQFCYYCLDPHDHNISTHVHGPNYIAPIYQPYYPYHRRRGQRVKKVATVAALTVGAIIFGPPAVVIGALPYAAYLGVNKLRVWNKQRKLIKNKKCDYAMWIVAEKKRREDLNLPVSEYITQQFAALQLQE
ncbi:hypothetical protein SAMD00019534_096640 [Acytostelium subglobosum LB1]|uniref:hypothetical protein n=1 Tax=Acytostelium subglobosum LB1 TaxID=1410327 RepID=UPI000644EFA0|nr:hypothetical protein SAMD00019534_096640 [Acytostelium subglobosum LB1]GAM26489.1 hypothetical protein SAMD00019534_096640 [Acytostelium subglobosum LB1]|eukprot:XP_012750585.1 hypothetical protein SAMD00019534_096640 [Acytostelium subglobosum LB1]